MKISRKRLALMLGLLAAAALSALAFRPRPVAVEVGRAAYGPLRVTLDEDGETRVRDRYVIGAPVAGRLQRIQLDEGDPVDLGAVVARLEPLPLDPRAHEQAQSRLRAAAAEKREADAQAGRASAALEEARRKLRRAERLAIEDLLPPEDLDAARTAARTAEAELAAARSHAQAAAYDVESARAALLEGEGQGSGTVPLRSPVQGRVLRVCEECDKVVAAGTPLLELGDAEDVEVVVDVLSSDAVHVQPGTLMLLDAGMGGEQGELRARVRLVEPSGFTKVSPLGVEEQRVNVIGDLVDPPGRLGDRYRVEAKIVLWEAERVLQVPAGALFRHGGGWSVFVIEDGRARRREVGIGHRSPDAAEILAGLAAGETVVVHPGDRLEDGARVRTRPGA
jgi:HlyD family secretion protein